MTRLNTPDYMKMPLTIGAHGVVFVNAQQLFPATIASKSRFHRCE